MSDVVLNQADVERNLKPVTTGPDHTVVHHGRTMAAWVGSIVTGIGAVIAAIGFLMNINAFVAGIGVGVMVAGAMVGGILRKMGYGQQG